MTQDATTTAKPVVYYKSLMYCKVGEAALVFPTDHPKRSNTQAVRTSNVVSYDQATGEFETRNTRYTPLPDATRPD